MKLLKSFDLDKYFLRVIAFNKYFHFDMHLQNSWIRYHLTQQLVNEFLLGACQVWVLMRVIQACPLQAPVEVVQTVILNKRKNAG